MTDPEPPRGSHLLEAVLLATLVLGPAIGVGVGLDAGTGSIAEWVAALATVAAFIAAVFAGMTASRLWRIEADRDEDRRKQDAQKQAVQIAVWYGPRRWQPTPPPSAEGRPPPPPRGNFGVWIHNASQTPVTQVAVRVFGHSGQLYQQGVGTLPPDPEPVFVPAPGAMRDFLNAQHWDCTAQIHFRNAAGAAWTRARSGRLHSGLTSWRDEVK